LFREESLEKIKKGMERWEKEVLKDTSCMEGYYTDAGIPIKLLYTPNDIADFDYEKDLGYSGTPPFVRGVYPNMYRGRLFTVRQLAGFGTPAACNQRFKFLLNAGATGVSALFDLPTIRGYDSDDPEAEGNIGECGAAIDSLLDVEELFDGIPIGEVSAAITTHLPSTTVAMLAMYSAMAERRGVPLEKLAGTSQNDFIMETCVGSAPEILPPAASFRLQCDAIEFAMQHMPRWNPISYNGYNLREAGTSAVTEVGVALSNCIATCEELIRRGHSIDDFAKRISFFWDLCNDFFEEIAKCRASRKLFYEIIKDRFGSKNERSMLMRFHVQTAGIALTSTEPINNVARSAIQGLAAILGGAQSLHIDSYDEAYSAPTEEAALVSLRTQQILQVETNVCSTVDPLAGSYFVEHLTNEMVDRIKAFITKVESMGGLVKAVENGWLHREIANYSYEEQRKIESGEKKIAGVNYFPSEDATSQKIDVFRYPETASVQLAKMKKLKAERNNEKVQEKLKTLAENCHTSENLVPFVKEAILELATWGEIQEVFRKEFGLWQFPLI
jgi:methylmalonyl-CoA mutase N-terminal domain/subunit